MSQINLMFTHVFDHLSFVARPAALAVVGLGAAIVVASPAVAAPLGTVPFTSPNGSGSGFTFSDGFSSNGLFGDPTVSGDGMSLLFFPANFTAFATNGGASIVSDTLQLTITAAPGQQIDGINISEIGDFSIVRGGAVDAEGLLILTDLATGTPFTDTLDTTPDLPLDTDGSVSGQFNGSAIVDLPDGVTMVRLVFNNILTAAANPGGAALIQKKFVNAGIDIEIITGNPGGDIPEPATAAVLFGGIGFLATRRRRA